MAKERRNRWSKVGMTFLIVVTIILSGLAIAYGSTDLGMAASTYEKNRAAAEKNGLFFTDEQVNEHFKVPDADNGMSLLKAIETKALGSPPDLTDDEIKARKSDIDAAIKKFAEVSQRKFLVSKSIGPFLDFSEGAKVKNGVKILCRMAKFSSDHGDLNACRGYLHSAAFLSNAADDMGDIIPVLIRIACAAMIEARLQKMIPTHANDPAWLTVIEDTLKQLDQPYDLSLVVKLDHRWHMTYVEMIKKEPMTLEQIRKATDLPLSMRLGYWLPKYQKASLSRVHEYYSGLANLLPTDPFDYPQLKKAVQFDRDFQTRKGWSYEAMMEPEFQQFPKAVWKEISNRNALFQAVAMLKTHANPAKGLPLPGRFRIDLDGKPIRIKHLAKGWVVYSLFDENDDGGSELVRSRGDFVVHLSAATAPPESKPKGQKYLNQPSTGRGPAPSPGPSP